MKNPLRPYLPRPHIKTFENLAANPNPRELSLVSLKQGGALCVKSGLTEISGSFAFGRNAAGIPPCRTILW